MPPKDKKEKPKEKPTGWNLDPLEALVILLFLLAILGTVIPAVWNYITSGEISFFGFKFSGLINFFKLHLQFFRTLGFVIAGVSAIGAFIFTKKGDAIWREEKAKVYPENMTMSVASGELAKNPLEEKWKKIVANSESEDPSLWRLCIIEADIILSDLLDTLRLPGDTIGEKLKAVERSDFNTIDSAWEAHKARNMIAHEGANFLLNQRETRRIIGLYRAVFKEFFLI